MKTATGAAFTHKEPLPTRRSNGNKPRPTSSWPILLCALYHDLVGLSNPARARKATVGLWPPGPNSRPPAC